MDGVLDLPRGFIMPILAGKFEQDVSLSNPNGCMRWTVQMSSVTIWKACYTSLGPQYSGAFPMTIDRSLEREMTSDGIFDPHRPWKVSRADFGYATEP
jgi:hypothetical protein